MDSNSTDVEISNSTTTGATSAIISILNTTIPSTSVAAVSTKATLSTTTGNVITSTNEDASTAATEDAASPALFLFSFVLFLVAISLIAKVIVSNRKKRDIIGGSARWRLSASSQSTTPLQTDAGYTPVGTAPRLQNRNPLDTAGENRLDWERQFFDDHDASSQPQSRLRLDFNRI